MRASAERTLICLFASAVIACATEGRPARYALGEEIDLGIISLSVSEWHEVRATSSPLRSLYPPEGEKPVVVFVRWRGLGEYADFDRRRFVEAFLRDRLTLVDSDGFEYEALSAIPEGLYQMSGGVPGVAPPEWVVVFWAWVDSAGFTLHIEHPEPDEGGFHVAVVDLR